MADAAVRIADTPVVLGGVVRARRRDLGLSQVDLAELAGVAVKTVYEIERGKATTQIDVLCRVLDVLGMRLTAVRDRPPVGARGGDAHD